MSTTRSEPRTPEDIHAGYLSHPRLLGAAGCICEIKARIEAEAAAPDAGLREALDTITDKKAVGQKIEDAIRGHQRKLREEGRPALMPDGWTISEEVVDWMEDIVMRAFAAHPAPAPDAGLREANLAGGLISLREIAEAPRDERLALLDQRLAEKQAELDSLAAHPAPAGPAVDGPAALDVERLAEALNATVGKYGWARSTPPSPVEEWLVNARRVAIEYARLQSPEDK